MEMLKTGAETVGAVALAFAWSFIRRWRIGEIGVVESKSQVFGGFSRVAVSSPLS